MRLPILFAAAVLAGAVATSASASAKVVVSSKIDTEGGVLGNVIALALKANGVEVEDRIQLGGTPVVRKAIMAGEIDIYPEYTGNAAFFFNKADAGDAGFREAGIEGAILGSVLDEKSLQTLRATIAQVGWGGEAPDFERPHLASAREFDAVNEALDALSRARATIAAGDALDFAAPELQRAFASLGHVSGDEATEDLLDGIFARFCVGK